MVLTGTHVSLRAGGSTVFIGLAVSRGHFRAGYARRGHGRGSSGGGTARQGHRLCAGCVQQRRRRASVGKRRRGTDKDSLHACTEALLSAAALPCGNSYPYSFPLRATSWEDMYSAPCFDGSLPACSKGTSVMPLWSFTAWHRCRCNADRSACAALRYGAYQVVLNGGHYRTVLAVQIGDCAVPAPMDNSEPISPADLLDMIGEYDLVYPPDGDDCCKAYNGKRCEPLTVYMGEDPLEVGLRRRR